MLLDKFLKAILIEGCKYIDNLKRQKGEER